MAPKVEKEAAAPLKAKATVKALKSQQSSVQRHPQPHKKMRSGHHTHSDSPKHCDSGGSPNILRRAPVTETSLTAMPSSSSPSPEAATKETDDTGIHCGCQGQQALD